MIYVEIFLSSLKAEEEKSAAKHPRRSINIKSHVVGLVSMSTLKVLFHSQLTFIDFLSLFSSSPPRRLCFSRAFSFSLSSESFYFGRKRNAVSSVYIGCKLLADKRVREKGCDC